MHEQSIQPKATPYSKVEPRKQRKPLSGRPVFRNSISMQEYDTFSLVYRILSGNEGTNTEALIEEEASIHHVKSAAKWS
jgi:hypothetical protein